MTFMKISETKEYVFALRRYIYFSSILFFAGIIIGYDFPRQYPEETKEIIEELKSMFPLSENISSWEIFVLVLENNIMKLAGVLLLGVIGGIIPIIASFANGLILGIFAYLTSETISLEYFFAGILPHGILEIPALILSTAIGMKIGKVAVYRLFSGKESLKKEFAKALKFYATIIAPLIFIAALIEAFITPLFLSLFV